MKKIFYILIILFVDVSLCKCQEINSVNELIGNIPPWYSLEAVEQFSLQERYKFYSFSKLYYLNDTTKINLNISKNTIKNLKQECNRIISERFSNQNTYSITYKIDGFDMYNYKNLQKNVGFAYIILQTHSDENIPGIYMFFEYKGIEMYDANKFIKSFSYREILKFVNQIDKDDL